MCHDPKSPTHPPPPLRDDAKISGTGFASALTLLGNADATANDYVSGALALAFAGDSSTVSEADFGSFATTLVSGMGGPAALDDILGLKLVPGFGSDLIRVEMGPDGPKLGSDVGDWLSRLGSNAPSTTESDTGDTPTTAESAADVTPTPVIDASEPAPESDVDTSPATQTPQTGLPAAELDDAATPVDTGTPEEAADTAPDSTQDAPEADDSAIEPVDEAPASGSADADSDSSDSPEIE